MLMNRAYSLLSVKSFDEELRILDGIATTPTPDRLGDIVVPEGASFKLPLPLLWQHDSHQPIGHVTEARVSPTGIHIKAKIARVQEEGSLKNRLDEAWQSLKAGLVQGLSIGFKSVEKERLPEEEGKESFWGTYKFTKWEWLELSAVTIPANAEASITAIKTVDRAVRKVVDLQDTDPPDRNEDPSRADAASGKDGKRKSPPGAAGHIKLTWPKEGTDMKTIAEQITALENTRAAKAARMQEVMQKSIEEGRSTDEAEREEFDTLQREVEALDGDLKRLRDLEKAIASRAKAVDQRPDTRAGSDNRDPSKPALGPVRDLSEKQIPGIRFARLVRCLGLAQGNRAAAVELAKEIYRSDPGIANVLKAAVVAGSTSTATGNWGAELVGTETQIFADFAEFLRPQTIIGRFGIGGVPSLRAVPFRTALIGQTGGGTGYWVGEGKGKPLTTLDFSRTTLEPLKVANICVVTEEIIRSASPSAETIIRDSLVAALRERMDLDFINPDKAASAGVSPASILNGITAITSVGNDADAVRADINAIFAAFITANNPPTSGVWIMSARLALVLSLMMNPLGQPEFPGLTMNGGSFAGLPVITSEYVSPGTGGDFVALVNASDIYLADDGDVGVDMSREASLEMSDTPTLDSLAPTAAQLVSLWQTNSVGFRAERTINWKRRRDSGVAYLVGVHWGETVTA